VKVAVTGDDAGEAPFKMVKRVKADSDEVDDAGAVVNF
jgi:hypothetical protein